MEDHALGGHAVPAFGALLGGNLGLELVRLARVLGEEDQRTRGVGDGETVEHAGDLPQLGLVAHHRDQVADAGASFRGRVLCCLAPFAIGMQAPAHLVQLFLDRMDVDEGAGAELAVILDHGRRQRRPSCSISLSASGGPQVPAA